jgi:recombination protein RecT
MSTRLETTKRLIWEKKKSILSFFNGDLAKTNKFMATGFKVALDYNLNNCTPDSIVKVLLSIAELQLDPNPLLAEAYIVPYGKKATLIIGSKGYIKILAKEGWRIKSYIVGENDSFEYKIDLFDEIVKFEKNLEDSGDFKYAVALAQSPNKDINVLVMNKKEIEKHRKASNNQKSQEPTGVWQQWYEEMATKTVVKKLCKKLPLNMDISLLEEKEKQNTEDEINQQTDIIDIDSLLVE